MEYEIWFDGERIRTWDFAEAKRWAMERLPWGKYSFIRIVAVGIGRVMYLSRYGVAYAQHVWSK